MTLDGQPLVGARLMFQPEASGGSPSYGATDRDGRYELVFKRGQNGAMPGWHTVRIEGATDSGPNRVPPRYNRQSELRKDVKLDEENQFDFELRSNPS